MKSIVHRFQSKTRKLVQPYIRANDNLYKLAVSVHRSYCFITGFMHILPDFYIIGGQKSGTSALYDYLIQHPCIESAVTKEPRYFDKYYDRGINWYRVGFPLKIHKSFNKKILGKPFQTGEATPRYLDHPHSPKRIKKTTPNAKLIVLLRNPIDRAYSSYSVRINSGKEKLSFEEAIKREKERTLGEFEKMQKDPNYYSIDYYHHSYLDRGIYVTKLKHWMSIFPKEQFLIIQSDEFFKDTSIIYNKVLKFLNLPKWDLDEYKPIGVTKYKKQTMEPSTRKQLVEFFSPYNQQLYEFLGEKFDWDK